MYLRPTRPYKAYWTFAAKEVEEEQQQPKVTTTTPPVPKTDDPSQHKPSKDWYKKHPFHPQKPKKTKVVIIDKPPRYIVAPPPPPVFWIVDSSGRKRKHKHGGRKPDIGECVKTNGGRLYRGRVECEREGKRNCSETVFGKNCEDAEMNFCKMYGSLGGRCDGNPKYVPQTSGKDAKSEESEEPASGAVSGGFDFNNIPMPILLGGGLLVVMMMFMMMRK